MSQTKTCTHIKVTGVRCGSPSLYGEQFCYFHQHAHRGVRKPQQSRLHPIAILEDEESIQASLMEVINALMRNTIDLKRAELILRALHIAVKNARRAKFDNNASRVVREVPEYREATDPVPVEKASVGTGAFVRPATMSEAKGSDPVSAPGEEDELPAVAASTYRPVHPDPEFWERWERGAQVLKQKEAERKAAEAKATAQAPQIAAAVPSQVAAPPNILDMKKKEDAPTKLHETNLTQPTAIDLEAFAWTYSQKSGDLEQDGKKVATGYSGAGAGKNNPELQNVQNVGPIPQGDWTVTGPPLDTKTHGPYVLRLTPATETETFGRSGFLMHGDSREHPGTASEGCIILPRPVREEVWKSGDRDLKVAADHQPRECTTKGKV